MVRYDVTAADFPPQQFLRNIDELPRLLPAPPASAIDSAPFLYQTLPPLPLLPSLSTPAPLHPRALHRPSISLALSGGVDSSVSLFLLLEAGYSVFPVYMRTWDPLDESSDACPDSRDRQDAAAVCRHLGVELEEADFVRDYWLGVFDPLLSGYRRNRTPNPDVHCNRLIKCGRLLDWVRERRGSGELLATGHYARTQRVYGDAGDLRDAPYVDSGLRGAVHSALAHLDALRPSSSPLPPPLPSLPSTFHPLTDGASPVPSFPLDPASSPRPLRTTRLLTAVDARKDQTYFLSHIPPSALPALVFPLGGLHKSATRRLASYAGLPTASKPDSMGICMVGRRHFPDFLAHYLHLTPGCFVTPGGQRLAPHVGQEVYTIGQRAKVPGQPRRLYVAGKGEGGDVVVVDDRLHPLVLHDAVVVEGVNWLEGAEPRGVAEGEGEELWARFRSTEPLRRVRVRREEGGGGGQGVRYRVACVDMPHHLISPGQVVAFYVGEYCLGGGPILHAGPSYHAMNKLLQLRD